jgi:DNA-binding transcriptional ArsR family regulator
MRMLSLLNQGVASPSQLAEEVGESLSLVSYHIRILRELGCIELARTRPVRGAVEHFYRPLTRAALDTEAWATLPAGTRASLSSSVIEEIGKLFSAAFEAGTFDSRADRHLSFLELELDEQAWEALAEKLDELLGYATDLQAESMARTADGDRMLTALVLAHFERPPGARRSANGSRP